MHFSSSLIRLSLTLVSHQTGYLQLHQIHEISATKEENHWMT